MREPLLVLNAGSSSIKFSVFETAPDRSLSAGPHGQVEGIGSAPRLEASDAGGQSLADQALAADGHGAAIDAIHDWFATSAARRASPASAIASCTAARTIQHRC